MRHPALRRSARHSSKREARAEAAKEAAPPPQPRPAAPVHDPAGQNPPAPGVPPDGEHNQGGVRREGIDYQRDLGSEQDAWNVRRPFRPSADADTSSRRTMRRAGFARLSHLYTILFY